MYDREVWGDKYLYMTNKKYHLLSDKTSYASDIDLNFSSASSWLFGFLSGCHLRANFRYLMKQCKTSYLCLVVPWKNAATICFYPSAKLQ